MKQPANYQVLFKERLYFWMLTCISITLFYIPMVWWSIDAKLMRTFLGETRFEFLFGGFLIFFICLLVSPLLLMGWIRGNAVKVSSKQLPWIFDIVQRQSEQLGLERVPEVYIIDGEGMFNAFGIWFAFRNYVVLFSRVVDSAYQEGGDSKPLEFLLGHELGHLKRGHTGLLKTLAVSPAEFLFPPLALAYSRACEYTCDRIGYFLAPEGAKTDTIMMAVGERLARHISPEAYLESAQQDRGLATWLYSLFCTHPNVADRLKAVEELRIDLLQKSSKR